jgi:UDP-N-acetylmuramoyl-tripeptide--D-alanyl-D-alanine ligase
MLEKLKQIAKRIIVALLTLEAILILKKYRPRIIGVTGNVGKTSTKDAVARALGVGLSLRKSEKSYNSDIGVPLSILNAKSGWGSPRAWLETLLRGFGLIVFRHDYPAWLVLEVGADRVGDIKALTRWLRPDAAIFTRFAEVPIHVEFFSSPAELFREKSYLLEAVRPGGIVVLNADDEDVLDLKESLDGRRIVTFGTHKEATVRGTHVHIGEHAGDILPTGVSFKVEYDGKTIPVRIPGTGGDGIVHAVLAALALGRELDVDMLAMVDSFASYETPPGRARFLRGNKESLIIDDSYNAAPEAVKAALEMLKHLKQPTRKIVALGDITELGGFTLEVHEDIGARAAEFVSEMILVGPRAKFFGEGAKNAGFSEEHIHWFRESREAGAFLDSVLAPGDAVLVKGSQAMRMERVVEEVMAHPEEKEKLLVRQEPEWQER